MKYFLFLIAVSCTSSGPWELDAIAAGEKNFDSARLRYQDPSLSPLRFEIGRTGDRLKAFLSLSRSKFNPSQEKNDFVKVIFTFDQELKEEWIPLSQGNMKLRLSPEITEAIIETLQKGEKVGILVDSFEWTLSSENFPKFYEKLVSSSIFFENPIKGPLQ